MKLQADWLQVVIGRRHFENLSVFFVGFVTTNSSSLTLVILDPIESITKAASLTDFFGNFLAEFAVFQGRKSTKD